jgi:hypothetical protein
MNPAFSGTEGGLERVCLPASGSKEIVKSELRSFLEKAEQLPQIVFHYGA